MRDGQHFGRGGNRGLPAGHGSLGALVAGEGQAWDDARVSVARVEYLGGVKMRPTNYIPSGRAGGFPSRKMLRFLGEIPPTGP